MARSIPRQSRDDTREIDIVLGKYDKGLMTLLEESRIPPDGAKESNNLMQSQDGVWRPRWGTHGYGAVHDDPLDGASPTNVGGTPQLLTFAGGVVFRSTDGGALTNITGATLTPGIKCRALQIRDRHYIFNGVDPLTYFDGSNLEQYTEIDTPAAPTLTRGAGLTDGETTYYYQVVATNDVGFTDAGTEASKSVNKVRDDWVEANDEYIDVEITRITGADRYDVYIADASGFGIYLDSIADPGSGATVTYRDNGQVAANEFAEAPVDNTTAGPKFTQAVLSGNRIWATGDPSNPHRVYWGGTGQYQTYFSPFYGGGWIDLEKGGREQPKAVVDYRTGKGDPLPTVLTSDPEGNGSIWHIELQTAELGGTTVLVPNAMKVPGVGTNAPDSVVKVKSDIFLTNPTGVFKIGSAPTVLNVLITDEVSGNIRPTWRDLVRMNMDGAAGYYYDAKIFYAVPQSGDDGNSHILIHDTERRNWAGPWNVAVKAFLEYADSSRNGHFLAVPTDGNQLLEISDNFEGDDGAGFTATYASPLLPMDSRGRFDWGIITEGLFEFSGLRGSVTVQIQGQQKGKQFTTLAERTITGSVSNAGFGSLMFGEALFSEPRPAPVTFSQPSSKKRLKVNKLLNNVQAVVTSSTPQARWELLTINFRGFEVPISPPSEWNN